jgi:hypothetical protein
MTAALLWKEYRQQRLIWLAIAVLAILLVVSLAGMLGHTSGLQVFQERNVRGVLNAVLFSLAVAYGLVCGSLLLAGETDDGTLTFLDGLSARRDSLWEKKSFAGMLLVLSQGLVLSALALGLGFADWATALAFPVLCLQSLAWGLLGGALCRTVLMAVLSGVAMIAASWLLAVFSLNRQTALVLESVPALIAAYASRRVFCRNDVARRYVQQPQTRTKPLLPYFTDLHVLGWLMIRQARWPLIAAMVGTLLLALTINMGALVLWPLGTLSLGLVCGLAAFVPDQKDHNKFLGAQRFPAGKLWLAKTTFFGICCALLTGMAWVIPTVILPYASVVWQIGGVYEVRHYNNVGNARYWLGMIWMKGWPLNQSVNPILLLALWPIYGYSYGLLFGQLARRPVIALIFSYFLAFLFAMLWLPSLFIGGVPAWQIALIPVLLLVTSRLSMRPWLAGRLGEARPLMGFGGVAILLVIAQASCLWYRAVEVPDVGEPFDVTAFVASLPTPEKNEAGLLIRRAAIGLKKRTEELENKFAVPFLDDLPFDRTNGELFKKLALGQLARDVISRGWPKNDNKFIYILDMQFQGDWVLEAEKAARLPLGMVVDPRQIGSLQPNPFSFDQSESLGRSFCLRALQTQAQGDASGALKHVETALGLSRQMRNFATNQLLEQGTSVETFALMTLYQWMEKLGPNREELKSALAMLQRHEAALPDLSNSIKADYLVLRDRISPHGVHVPFGYQIRYVANLVPWEKERQIRIARASAAGILRLSQLPDFGVVDLGKSPKGREAETWFGLPPAQGPGSDLSVREWGQFLDQASSNYSSWGLAVPRLIAARSLRYLRAMQVVTAVCLYQADHDGKPPSNVEELVPAYLSEIPRDPFSGGAFFYRIEGIGPRFSEPTTVFPEREQLSPIEGQAVVFLPAGFGGSVSYLVPIWQK